MNDLAVTDFLCTALPLAFGAASGFALGLVFFVGLWWTVQAGVASARPARWFLGSALLRTGLVLAGFWWFATQFAGPDRLLACLAGFGLAQVLALRLPRAGARHPGAMPWT